MYSMSYCSCENEEKWFIRVLVLGDVSCGEYMVGL